MGSKRYDRYCEQMELEYLEELSIEQSKTEMKDEKCTERHGEMRKAWQCTLKKGHAGHHICKCGHKWENDKKVVKQS